MDCNAFLKDVIDFFRQFIDSSMASTALHGFHIFPQGFHRCPEGLNVFPRGFLDVLKTPGSNVGEPTNSNTSLISSHTSKYKIFVCARDWEPGPNAGVHNKWKQTFAADAATFHRLYAAERRNNSHDRYHLYTGTPIFILYKETK